MRVFHSQFARGLWNRRKPNGAPRPLSDSLTFRLLRYIKASAETLNFTRAQSRSLSHSRHSAIRSGSSRQHRAFNLRPFAKWCPVDRRRTNHCRIRRRHSARVGQTLAMARAVQRKEVPLCARLLLICQRKATGEISRKLRRDVHRLCNSTTERRSVLCLQRLDAQLLDCAILPCQSIRVFIAFSRSLSRH